MDLRAHLRIDFEQRRRRNPRYSLRAYALDLGISHSVLSRHFRLDARLTPATIRRLAARLGLTPSQTQRAALAEGTRALAESLRHPRFRPDSRRLAVLTGMTADQVNVALHELVRTRRLTLTSTSWLPEFPA